MRFPVDPFLSSFAQSAFESWFRLAIRSWTLTWHSYTGLFTKLGMVLYFAMHRSCEILGANKDQPVPRINLCCNAGQTGKDTGTLRTVSGRSHSMYSTIRAFLVFASLMSLVNSFSSAGHKADKVNGRNIHYRLFPNHKLVDHGRIVAGILQSPQHGHHLETMVERYSACECVELLNTVKAVPTLRATVLRRREWIYKQRLQRLMILSQMRGFFVI
jgi:hypothetical protein